MEAALIALVVALLIREFQHDRQTKDLLEASEAERRSESERAQDERRRLLNRLQSPEIAAYEASEEPTGEQLHVPDYDEAWKAEDERQGVVVG